MKDSKPLIILLGIGVAAVVASKALAGKSLTGKAPVEPSPSPSPSYLDKLMPVPPGGWVQQPLWTIEWSKIDDAAKKGDPVAVRLLARLTAARTSSDERAMLAMSDELRLTYPGLSDVFATGAKQRAIPAAPAFRYFSKDVPMKQVAEGGGWRVLPPESLPAGPIKDRLVAVAKALKIAAAERLSFGDTVLTRPFAEHDLMRIVMNPGNLEVWGRL